MEQDDDIDSFIDETFAELENIDISNESRSKKTAKVKDESVREEIVSTRPPEILPTQVVSQGSPRQLKEDATARLLNSIAEDYNDVGQEIIDSWRKNNTEIQAVIDHLKDALLDGSVVSAQTGAIPGVYLEQLVKAMDVKSNMSMTVVKVLEAKTKLLAASKSGSGTRNSVNVNITTPSELDSILSQPVDDDFQ